MTDKRLQEIEAHHWEGTGNDAVAWEEIDYLLTALRRSRHEARAEAFEEAARHIRKEYEDGGPALSIHYCHWLREQSELERTTAAKTEAPAPDATGRRQGVNPGWTMCLPWTAPRRTGNE